MTFDLGVKERSSNKQPQMAKVTVTMLSFDRHSKLSTMTSSSDLWLRGQMSNFKHAQNGKSGCVNVLVSGTNINICQQGHLHLSYKESKVKERSTKYRRKLTCDCVQI